MLFRSLQGKHDNYDIDLFQTLIHASEEATGVKAEGPFRASHRVIADHLRSSSFLIADGVLPSNEGRGYVLRRIMRRAMRHAQLLGAREPLMYRLLPALVREMGQAYPELIRAESLISETLKLEETRFRKTLERGLGLLGEAPESLSDGDSLDGETAFKLYDTFGFPVELSTEEAFKQDIKLSADWRQEFDDKMAEQRARSQTAAKGTFKGGLGGQTLQHKKYHTATHLMYAALKKVVGDHVTQHGSNITEERLRFDFNNDEKVTREQLDEVEKLVNEWISWDLPVSFQEYPTDQAFEMGAIGAFGDKYGETVKVYKMGDEPKRVSFEICGGPHVDHTGQLAEDGKIFKITKEESSSAGIRRVKAILA